MLGKAELLEAIATINRGILATEADKAAVLAAATRLEERNPTPRPLEAVDLLAGNWRLLYTTSEELLRIDRVPFLTLGQIYQYIQPEESAIYNIAEVTSLPGLEGIVSVAAKFTPESNCRVQVRFQRLVLGLQKLVNYRSANDFVTQLQQNRKFAAVDIKLDPTNQQGWLDVTYLDETLRIGRGNEGNLFVLLRA
jgi:hypothetical protein